MINLVDQKILLKFVYKIKYMPLLTIGILVVTHAAAFTIGALVFRNNSAVINKDISTVQADASKVETAATAVATDVKKA